MPWDGGQARRQIHSYASDSSGKMEYGKASKCFLVVDKTAIKSEGGKKYVTQGACSYPYVNIVNGQPKPNRDGLIAAWGSSQGSRDAKERPALHGPIVRAMMSIKPEGTKTEDWLPKQMLEYYKKPRADAAQAGGSVIDTGPGWFSVPLRITAEDVRSYPESGDEALNGWDDLKLAQGMEGMPFFASHSDRSKWGDIVKVEPNDETRSWDGQLMVFEDLAPAEFQEKAKSGEVLPASWEYKAKSTPATGDFNGKPYNVKLSDYTGLGVAYAPDPWVARCPPGVCGINQPIFDAALLSNESKEDGSRQTEADKLTADETKAAPKTGEPDKKQEAEVTEAQTTETGGEKVVTKQEESTSEKVETKIDESAQTEVKADVRDKKETQEEGQKEVTGLSIADIVKGVTEAIMPQVNKAIETAVSPLNKDLTARHDAEKQAFEDAREKGFRDLLNAGGKAKADAEPEFFKSYKDAEEKRTTALWISENKEFMDAFREDGVRAGRGDVRIQTKDSDFRGLSFSGKSPVEMAKVAFPGVKWGEWEGKNMKWGVE